MYKGKQVTLQGDPSLHYPALSLKKMDVSPSQLVLPKKVQLEDDVGQMDPAVSAVLPAFESVFEVPVGLPPVRGMEHSITLLPGV